MNKIQGFILYKIYYDNNLVYLGRTKQPLQDRIRGHLFQKPMHRTINIECVSKIEYAEFSSEADMNVYEIYFINLFKPPLNVDDKCRDELSIKLPEVQWKILTIPLWDKWVRKLKQPSENYIYLQNRISAISEQIRFTRSRKRMGEITEDECYDIIDDLNSESQRLKHELYG